MNRMRALVWGVLLVPTVVLANTNSFGQIADNIFGPVELVTQIMLATSYVAGAALVLFGLLQFKAHRVNPKMVPITMPFVLIISGLLLLALPKVSTKQGWSFAATVQKNDNASTSQGFVATPTEQPEQTVPAPTDHTDSEGPEHAYVPQSAPDVPPAPAVQPQPAVPPSGNVYVDPDEPKQ